MAKGEALSCLDLYKLTATEAAQRIASSAPTLTVTWLALPDGPLAPGAQLNAPYAGWRVVNAYSPGAGTVLVNITADGQWPFLTDPLPEVDPLCKGK